MSIYDFKHGVRIPAGSCSTYSNTPKAELISASGGLDVFNYMDLSMFPVFANSPFRRRQLSGSL